MKDHTEGDLGFFPGDDDFFAEIYKDLIKIDALEFAASLLNIDK